MISAPFSSAIARGVRILLRKFPPIDILGFSSLALVRNPNLECGTVPENEVMTGQSFPRFRISIPRCPRRTPCTPSRPPS